MIGAVVYTEKKPAFLSYVQETFKYQWTWNWKLNKSKRKWYIESLIPHCYRCNHRMLIISDINSHYLECNYCGFNSTGLDYEDRKQIEKTILQRTKINYGVYDVVSILGNRDLYP